MKANAKGRGRENLTGARMKSEMFEGRKKDKSKKRSRRRGEKDSAKTMKSKRYGSWARR